MIRALCLFVLLISTTYANTIYWEMDGKECKKAEYNPYVLQEKNSDKCNVSVSPVKNLNIALITLRCKINGEERLENYFASKNDCTKMVNFLKAIKKPGKQADLK